MNKLRQLNFELFMPGRAAAEITVLAGRPRTKVSPVNNSPPRYFYYLKITLLGLSTVIEIQLFQTYKRKNYNAWQQKAYRSLTIC